MRGIRFVFFVLSITQYADLLPLDRSYVNHKEMSEYCKRRVLPSIFLGKDVRDGNLNVIHFARLDLPYSCMLAIRTESGNNIILVMELIPNIDLRGPCSKNRDQVIVHDLGETFGGYWGSMSEDVMMPATSNETKFYTIKTTTTTTPSTTVTESEIKKLSKEETKMSTTVSDLVANEEDKYITVEVPLVNISGNLQLEHHPLEHVDDIFDAIYNVTPNKNVEYRTTLLPLIKFSIHRQTEGQNNFNTRNKNALYDLDYNINDSGFTLDSRLIFSTAHKRVLTKKSNWLANRRVHYVDKNVKPFRKKTMYNYFTRLFTTKKKLIEEKISTHIEETLRREHASYFNRSVTTTDPQDFIDHIINSYNLTTSALWEEDITKAILLDRISNLKNPNISAYLFSNLSLYSGYVSDDFLQSTESSRRKSLASSTKRFSELSLDTAETEFSSIKTTVSMKNTNGQNYNGTREIFRTRDNDTIKFKLEKQNSNTNTLVAPFVVDQEKKMLRSTHETLADTQNEPSSTDSINVKLRNFNTVYDNKKVLMTGSLVDRESWENIVQVAPMLATVLNKTEALNKNRRNAPESSVNLQRGKRYVKSLEFEQSEPRNLTVIIRKEVPKVTKSMISNLQHLEQLIELQDDEIQGRITLRYLSKYIGPVLFNICETQNRATPRVVRLMNSSRIVIAINNFTLDRMFLVVTPAIALLNKKAECPKNHKECQIMGTRVCIDSIKACDGVPNCGSDSIYDEDRITCGIPVSAHHVIFAVFASLVVFLTVIYIVYYWIMRCIPGVAEAFFIYNEESENTLRLKTIMRSPMDEDDEEFLHKPYLPCQFSDDDLNFHDIAIERSEGKCRNLLLKCFSYILCKKQKNTLKDEKLNEEEDLGTPPKFDQNVEPKEAKFKKNILQKDEIVQTGGSLEMQTINNNNNIKESDDVNYNNNMRVIDELDIIKLINKKSSSLQSDSDLEQKIMQENIQEKVTDYNDEIELENTLYERRDRHSDISRGKRNDVKEKMQLEQNDEQPIEKNLRFNENPTLIPDLEYSGEHDIDVNIESSSSYFQSKPDPKTVYPVTKDRKDSRNYWKLPKVKKPSKLAKMSLR